MQIYTCVFQCTCVCILIYSAGNTTRDLQENKKILKMFNLKLFKEIFFYIFL